jgi:hypothetical protein
LALLVVGGAAVVLYLRRKISLVHAATQGEDWVIVQDARGNGQLRVNALP